MNWKTRQLFSDREHGIVSGLSPVNMMGGGSVPIPGYEDGGTAETDSGWLSNLFQRFISSGPDASTFDYAGRGIPGNPPEELHQEEPSIEQQVAALAAQQGISVPAARATILKQMVQEKGLTLSNEIINQFATGLITLHDALAQAVEEGSAPKDISFEEGKALSEQAHMIHNQGQQRQMIEYALEEEGYAKIEQRVAELAAQQGISVPSARGMILDQVLQEKGLTLPIKIINQFATGLITLHEALTQAVDVGSGEDAPFEAASWKEIWEGDINDPIHDKNTLGDKLRYPISAVTTPMQKGMGELAELLGQVGIDVDPINPRLGKQAVGPPKMQAGTGLGEAMAIDLFQQGDEEINAPLNRMVQSTNPSIADITPTETVEETVTVTEDQGPTDVSALKEAFQELAMKAVDAAKDAIAQGASVEQVQGPLQERLMMIDEQYRQKSGTQDTILTEEFLIQLGSLTDISAEVVSMQAGGSVPDLPPINDLDRARYELDEAEIALAAHKAKRKPAGTQGFSYDKITKRLEAAVQTLREKVRILQGDAENVTGTSTDGPAADVEAKAKADAAAKAKADAIAKAKAKADAEAKAKENKEEKKDIIPALTTQGFWEEMKANANRAKLGTMMSGKSKQGGILGTMDVLGQSEVAGAKALGDAQESTLSHLGASERTAATLGKPTSLTKEERDLDKGSILLLSKMFADNVQKADGDIFEAMEQFTRAGYKIPANLKGLITGTVTITDTKGNTKKDMPFSDYYRLREGKTDSKGKILTFEEIAAEFSKLVAAGGVYDARNP